MADLAVELGELLAARCLRLSCAESCTGGWICKRITDVSGSSNWFDRGFITYSDAAKSEMLGVTEATLRTHGAVSEPVAREMAEGALQRGNSHVALAVTGIAGPDGGTDEKPVGTVWLAWTSRDGATRTQLRRFSGDRENVRRAAVRAALEGVIRLLTEINSTPADGEG